MNHAGTPTPTPTGPGVPGASATGTNDTISGIIHFIVEHPIPFILAVAWFGILYLYNYKLRPAQIKKGRPIQPLGRNISRTLKFALREDTGPVFTKPKNLATKTTAYTWQRHYLTLLALIILTHFLNPTIQIVLILVLALTVAQRARAVFTTRHGVLMQMFAIASAECKYPRDAAFNPWGWIQIKEWHDQIRPGTTAVSFPPGIFQAEDYKTREKFERNFNGTVSDEHMWTYKWESTNNRIVLKPTPHLPEMAPYPGPGSEWNKIVLGTAGEGEQAIWDVAQFPHALVCGPTGTGKSVLQRMILFHALIHADKWRIVGVDPKMVEMNWLEKYPNVLKIALDLEEGVEVVRNCRDEMTRRYSEMKDLGVNHFLNLPDPPPALMLIVDETFNFLSPEGIKSEEGKERDELHAQASALLGEIARLGRAAGVHEILASQRPDATVLRGELKNNLDCRIAAGRMDTTPSLMVLDSEAAVRLPKVRGRGLVRLGGDLTVFQGYFAEQDWYDKYVEAGQAALDGVDDDIVDGGADLPPAGTLEGVRKRLGGLNPLARVNAFVERKQSVVTGEQLASQPVGVALESAHERELDVAEVVDAVDVEDPVEVGPVPEDPADDADLFSSDKWYDHDDLAAVAEPIEPVVEPAVTVEPSAPAVPVVVPELVPVMAAVEPEAADVPVRPRGIPMVSFTPPVPPEPTVTEPARMPAPARMPEPVRTAPAPAAAPSVPQQPAPAPQPVSEPVLVPPAPLVAPRRPLPGTHRPLPGTPARPAAVAPPAVAPAQPVPAPVVEPVPVTVPQGSPTWGAVVDGTDNWD